MEGAFSSGRTVSVAPDRVRGGGIIYLNYLLYCICRADKLKRVVIV